MTIDVAGYSIKRKIADGGMASVFLAVQESLQRDVALKILAPGNDDAFRQRFINEGRLLASLSHPNIITIYDIGVMPDGHGYIAMEYLAGGDLAARVRQPMPAAQALRLLKQLAEALAIVHRAGIVHRDIKPANILFRADDTVVISDFGVARRERQDIKLTMDGFTVGSPAYCSPEQLQGRVIDGRADIYSLGVTFYQMLMAHNPYAADSYADTVVNHMQMQLPALPARLVMLQPLIDRMLAKDPQYRFANCDELIAAIDATGDVPDSIDTMLMSTTLRSAPTMMSPAATAVSAVAEVGTIVAPVARPARRVLQFVAMILVLALLAVGSAALMRVLQKHQQIKQELAQAEIRFGQKKYLLPESDSAVFYYYRALQIDADNPAALQGLQKVAARYEQLAREAFAANRYDRGMRLIERGLKVVPDHAGLLQLKKEQQALGHPTSRFFRNIFR
jgi:tetratricopeptide (TPR) repeat protein